MVMALSGKAILGGGDVSVVGASGEDMVEGD
jgi:hypothetical protein